MLLTASFSNLFGARFFYGMFGFFKPPRACRIPGRHEAVLLAVVSGVQASRVGKNAVALPQTATRSDLRRKNRASYEKGSD